MHNHDLQFLKRFSMVMAFLVLVALILIALAFLMAHRQPHEAAPGAQARLEQRIAPVGAVYAGETGAAAAAAAAKAALEAAASQVAYDGTLDGSVIYGKLCAACHGTGAGGAPTLDHSHWDARIAQGMDTLIKHSIEGYQGAAGLMPARGGNPALNDEQMQATVKWMLDNLK
ncbi:MAG: c-type cytochrome [Lysobacteraceae bacterium]